ncbi:transposase [Hydrogenophaga sp. 2FB]|uniref:transposase n=1 Tax=Hydrogenophaga sp. 2FB TaxID=2502187 RepID=UPI00339499D9
MPTAEEFAALQKALAQATQTSESLAGELRITRAERDLLEEPLNKFKRQLFAAKSEASADHQKDMFFNEAEALGSAAHPAQQESEADDNAIEVPAHKRTKRGRNPSSADRRFEYCGRHSSDDSRQPFHGKTRPVACLGHTQWRCRRNHETRASVKRDGQLGQACEH